MCIVAHLILARYTRWFSLLFICSWSFLKHSFTLSNVTGRILPTSLRIIIPWRAITSLALRYNPATPPTTKPLIHCLSLKRVSGWQPRPFTLYYWYSPCTFFVFNILRPFSSKSSSQVVTPMGQHWRDTSKGLSRDNCEFEFTGASNNHNEFEPMRHTS